MVTVRKLATAAAVSLALSTTGAYALTLGEIEMRSALNQPMDAEIRLSTANPNEVDGMIVKLASQDAFLRAGIDRTAVLNDLQFQVAQGVRGEPVIQITSRAPVLEPFLNFLLEVDWPQGRMVREYTVLLDPPVFMAPDNSQRANLSENVLQRADESVIIPSPIERASGGGSFDLGSVAVMGSGEEVADSQAFDSEISLSGFDDSALDDSTIVSLDSLDATPIGSDGGTDVFLGGDTFTSDVQPGTEFGSEVVTLTDLDSDTGDVFANSTLVASESFDGFDIQVLGDTQEVGNDVGGSVVGGGVSVLSGSSNVSGDVAVRKGDTLWEIANANRVGGLSTQQMMLALLDANQKAFINGNINLIKQGAILRIPTADQAAGLSQSAAIAQVAQQEQLWREYRDSSQAISGSRVASRPAPVETFDGDSDATGSEALGNNEEQSSLAGGITKQEILDQARQRLQESRNELKLVGENESTDVASSTSADESEQPDTANLGALNRRLQLAREELASTRLRAGELSSRDQELQGTAENMDTLVNLRQNEVARLERQLADAREGSQATLGDLGDQASRAAGSLEELTDAVGDEGVGVVQGAADQLPQVELFEEEETSASFGADDQTATAGADADSVASPSRSRVVQPVTAAQPQAPKAWYEGFFTDTNKLIIGGVGLAALLGLLGTFFFRRRNKQTDSFDAFEDEDIGFADNEMGSGTDIGGFEDDFVTQEDTTGSFGAAAVAGGAAVAGVGAAAASHFDDDYDYEQSDNTNLDPFADSSERPAVPVEADSYNHGNDDSIGADDTISEADVYLAYGLHGQAEDLLHKAIEQDPSRPDYQFKLMQTYHAQGNAEGFDDGALAYHHNFGGENDANWSAVAKMGSELSPNNSLYGSAGEGILSVGRGDINAPKLDDTDFNIDVGESHVESSVREFGQSDFGGVDSDDESLLMDQSIDPGMAFAESDLEATGDFTQIANDLKHHAGDTLEVPESLQSSTDGLADFGNELTSGLGGDLGGGLGGDLSADLGTDLGDGLANSIDSVTDGVGDKASDVVGGAKNMLGGAAAGIAGVAGTVGLGGDSKASELDTSGLDLQGKLGAAADSVTSSADDLTMDLDQLSGDLNLDSSELGANDADLTSDLEIPDLSATGDLTSDASAAFGNADEMDTMMDLAKAYIDMGDKDSASSALGEIVKSGSPEQKSEAETLLKKIS